MPPETPAETALRTTYDGLLALIIGRSPTGAPAPDAGALVIGDARAGAAARVHVYQHMYRSRMIEALESQFPRVARWLGTDAFGEITAAYVADEPSRHPSLRFVGARFPDWLARRADRDGDDRGPARHAALADLARLEWARTDVFDAADEPPLAIAMLRAWPADRFAELPLRLVVAHRRLTLAHPVAALWDAIGPAGDTPSDDPARAGEAARAARPESLLVWRQGVSVFHRATDTAERGALDSMDPSAGGTTFGLICEALGEHRPGEAAAAQAFAWLSTWSADELLVAPPE